MRVSLLNIYLILLVGVSCTNSGNEPKAPSIQADAKAICECADKQVALISEMEAIPPISDKKKSEELNAQFEKRLKEVDACVFTILERYGVNDTNDGEQSSQLALLEKAVEKQCPDLIELLEDQ